MNRIKLAYVRYCNTSKRIRKKRLQRTIDSGVQGIYNNIRDMSTYKGFIHNFFQIYKFLKQNPDHKFLKYMVNSHYIKLAVMKAKWKFAKQLYKDFKKELEAINFELS